MWPDFSFKNLQDIRHKGQYGDGDRQIAKQYLGHGCLLSYESIKVKLLAILNRAGDFMLGFVFDFKTPINYGFYALLFLTRFAVFC